MPKRSRSYEIGLTERLKDSEYALAYLEAAWEDSDDVFLLALRDVATAKGISAVAAAAGVNRENLYRGLSKKGNPTFSTLRSVLKALNVPFGPRSAASTHAVFVYGAGLSVPGSVAPSANQAAPPATDYPDMYSLSEDPAPAPWLANKFTEMETEASLYSVQ